MVTAYGRRGQGRTPAVRAGGRDLAGLVLDLDATLITCTARA
ncbi:hypothetical protein ABZT02_40310 [Streptomyces sp. NPDC005402]